MSNTLFSKTSFVLNDFKIESLKNGLLIKELPDNFCLDCFTKLETKNEGRLFGFEEVSYCSGCGNTYTNLKNE